MAYIPSPIPYVGGKGLMRDDILQSMPVDCVRYIEVFGGGGTIILSKPRHKFELYNDYNSDLVNMFRCIKDKPIEFFRESGLFPINSRQDFKLMLDFMEHKEPDFSIVDNELKIARNEFTPKDVAEIERVLVGKAKLYDVERAATFYKLIRLSYSSMGKNFGGQPVNISGALENIFAISKRLEGVVIENKDFADVIKLHDKPGTFMYLDPPYYTTESFYCGFTKQDHIRLYECLRGTRHTKFLLSYNGCEFIEELYKPYTIVKRNRLHSMVQRYNAGSRFEELLIANYDINERRKQMPKQLSVDKDGNVYYEQDILADYRESYRNSYTVYISRRQ